MEKLNILWTSGEKDTAIHMLSMYAINARAHGWWQEVNVIIWGASANLAATDPEVQSRIDEMISHGVNIEACKACSDNLGVTEKLTDMGANVRYMGQALTGYIKNDEKLLTI